MRNYKEDKVSTYFSNTKPIIFTASGIKRMSAGSSSSSSYSVKVPSRN